MPIAPGSDHEQRTESHPGPSPPVGPDQLAIRLEPRKLRARAPVARMMCGDLSVATGFAVLFDHKLCLPASFPCPSNTVTLFFLKQ